MKRKGNKSGRKNNLPPEGTEPTISTLRILCTLCAVYVLGYRGTLAWAYKCVPEGPDRDYPRWLDKQWHSSGKHTSMGSIWWSHSDDGGIEENTRTPIHQDSNVHLIAGQNRSF